MLKIIQKIEVMVRWLYCKVKNTAIGGIQSIVAGTNITIDNTDPANPVVSSTGGGGIIHLIIILQEWLTSIQPKMLYQEFHKRIRLLSKLI